MVAPYEIGAPVRSFVLVPGTGKDKEAKSLCLDLARASSVAGAIAVPLTVPSAVPMGGLKPSDQSEGVDSQDKKNGSQEGKVPPAPPTRPGPSTEVRQASVGQGGVKRSLQVDAERIVKEGSPVSAPAAKMMRTAEPVDDGSRRTDLEVAELHRRCEALEKENGNLNRRLALFHELFKSKKRLISFVKFLETS